MFPDYVYAIFLVLVIIMAVGVFRAMKEDQDEFNRLLTLSSHMPENTTPESNPDLWRNEFVRVYGREPKGNSTTQVVKNTVLGTFRGGILGFITGGWDGALKYAAVQGFAAPTLMSSTESWINNDSIIPKKI